MNFKEKLNRYSQLEKEIHEYFGYVENWVCIPMDDQTDDYWMVMQDDTGKGRYVHSPKPFTSESIVAGKGIYGGSIYTQRFLPKWVYRGMDFTMVCVDTHTDGDKFLIIFDNKKECQDAELKQLYTTNWSF